MDERPTAIVTVDDFVAMSVLREAAAAGIDVPGELSVIGCNNASLAEQVYPPLTSIDIHMYEIGFQAAELFDRLVYNSAPVANIIVRHDLIVRKSTAPCCARENERARVKK